MRLERLARVFPYPITTLKSSPQVTKIFRFTSAYLNLSVVSANYLLVDKLLPSRTEIIDRDRSQPMGMYQSVYG
ncbi:hypothetical protein [Microcoleus vaginatus]|uniref:hypothetical protein n=1 Tax=Microcoleus vaginatus TaxID=119532 RepID=UPI0032A87F7F